MLDTSAVIGWVELQDPSLVRWLLSSAGDEVPAVHAVSLGELERGVMDAPDEATARQRQATLTFSSDELEVVPLTAAGEQAHLFGAISSAVGRKVSHNDCWITAAALERDDTLITMDQRLADQLRAADSEVRLADWLRARGRTLNVRYFSR